MSGPLARSRAFLAAGAVIALLACALPWGRTAAAVGNLPVIAYGFDGPGILVFVGSVAVLALRALAWADADLGVSIARPVAFAAVVALAAVGLAVRAVQLADLGVVGLPDRSPGLWLAALGVVLMTFGVAQLLPERRTA